MNKVKINLIFLFLLTFGCKRNGHDLAVNFSIDSIAFDISGNMPVNPGNTQYIATDSGEYLLAYNPFTRNLCFLEFPTGKTIHEIHLEKEGEHGISSFNGGKITNKDSLWYLSNPPNIGLLNFRGKVLRRKSIKDDVIPLTIVGAPTDKPLHQHGNKIFAAQPLLMDHHNMKEEDVQKQRLVFSYDMATDSVEWYDVYYPEDYWNNGKKITNFSWAKRDGRLYIAPWYDHEVQVFDMEEEKVIGEKSVKSGFVNNFVYANHIPGGADEGFLLTFSHEQYSSLLYDEYRDVFYRFFLPSFDIKDLGTEYNYRDLLVSRPYLGIMVLDKDLNILGEHIFDKFQIYTLRNHFVGKEGLYLSLNNLFSPDYDEDRFRFLVFKPELVR